MVLVKQTVTGQRQLQGVRSVAAAADEVKADEKWLAQSESVEHRPVALR